MMLSCKAASQLVSQSLDAPLGWQDRLALRFHLAICRHCKRFSQQLANLRVMLKTMAQSAEDDENVQLKPEAKARIAQAIQRDL